MHMCVRVCVCVCACVRACVCVSVSMYSMEIDFRIANEVHLSDEEYAMSCRECVNAKAGHTS